MGPHGRESNVLTAARVWQAVLLELGAESALLGAAAEGAWRARGQRLFTVWLGAGAAADGELWRCYRVPALSAEPLLERRCAAASVVDLDTALPCLLARMDLGPAAAP